MSVSHFDPNAQARLLAFGRNLKRARQVAGVSQRKLALLSGVSQSVISRLERARAPRLALERLLLLHDVLGGALPFGACPHDHSCVWQPLTPAGERSHTPALASGQDYWERLRALRATLQPPTDALTSASSAAPDGEMEEDQSATADYEMEDEETTAGPTPQDHYSGDGGIDDWFLTPTRLTADPRADSAGDGRPSPQDPTHS
ncbi:MAG TPA: helix-turn-helix transcriptional regulator [Candidatus Limnocylindria bacterium]|nr:helix-turn-helix transcriptional regulator [Candidatus Limnocylindria bacterium]